MNIHIDQNSTPSFRYFLGYHWASNLDEDPRPKWLHSIGHETAKASPGSSWFRTQCPPKDTMQRLCVIRGIILPSHWQLWWGTMTISLDKPLDFGDSRVAYFWTKLLISCQDRWFLRRTLRSRAMLKMFFLHHLGFPSLKLYLLVLNVLVTCKNYYIIIGIHQSYTHTLSLSIYIILSDIIYMHIMVYFMFITNLILYSIHDHMPL